MFYIRKLSRRSSLFKIKTAESIKDVEADVLKQEFGTIGNTLSFWKCDDINDLRNAMKAILLSTTEIKFSQFIIVNDELLDKYEIERNYDEEGMTGYKGYEKLHVNLCNLNYEKIGALLNIIKEISKDEKYVPELSKDEVKSYIIEVQGDGLLDESHIHPELKKEIEKFCPLTA